MSEGFIFQGASEGVAVWNRGGVDWFDAPTPRRWHRCKAQTKALFDGAHVQRCACGAMNIDHTGWLDRNSARRT